MSNLPTRDEAWKILTKYVTTDHLQRHVLMVEGTMRHFARLYNEDEEAWGILGLLHDIDFELYPDEHLQHAPRILKEEGFDEDFIRSVVSHGYGICSDVEPVDEMEKVLFAADELTGLIGAAALMRPSKSCKDMEVSSLKKKYKDKKFAAGCSRDIIARGAEQLGWPLEELMEKTILAMRSCEDDVAAMI